MKRVLKWVGATIGLLCLLFFLKQFVNQWSAIRSDLWSWRLAAGIAVAVLLYLASYALTVRTWQLALGILGQHHRYRTLAPISLVAQFAKYIPGNVGHHIGKVALAAREGVPTTLAVSSILIDTAMVVGAACLGALASLKLLLTIAAHHPVSFSVPFLVVAALGAAGIGLALARRHVRARIRAFFHHNPTILSRQSALRLSQGVGLYVMSFLLGAVALSGLALALSPATPMQVGTVLGVYCIAWLFGFMPGVPAGLGIREAILLTGLSPMVGIEAATVVAGAFRLVTVTGDGLAFGCGSLWRALESRRRS